MTTIHSYTGDQPTLDRRHKDLYRARAAAMAMIPTSTGAAKALGEVLPALKGKLDGSAIRVPTPNVSAVDLTFVAKKDVTEADVNEVVATAAAGPMKGVLAYTDEKVVATDFRGESATSTFDAEAGIQLDDTFVKLISWYDNEWGYSCKVVEMARVIAA